MTQTLIIKNENYLNGLIHYINDVKPFHCKLTEVIEELQFEDTINVKIIDSLKSNIHLSSVWEENFYSDGRRTRNLVPNFDYLLYSNQSNLHHFTPTNNLGYLQNKGIYGFQLRAASGIESVNLDNTSLAEGLDYFYSHGMYSFYVANPSTYITSENTTIINNIVTQKDLANPINIGNIIFKGNPIDKKWIITQIGGYFEQTTSSNVWSFNHNLNSSDIIWQIFVNSVNGYEQILSQNTIIDNNSIQLDFNLNSYNGKLLVLKAESNLVYHFSNQTVIDIHHYLNTTGIFVSVVSLNNGELILPDSIDIVDSNRVRVLFNTPQSGKVIIVQTRNQESFFNPTSQWIINGDFANDQLPFIQIYHETTNGFSQLFPESLNLNNVSTNITSWFITNQQIVINFNNPIAGFVNLSSVNTYSVSNGTTIIGTTNTTTDVIKTFTCYPYQTKFYVDVNSLVVVELNGIILNHTEYKFENNLITLNKETNYGDILKVKSISNRFHNKQIEFDILNDSKIGSEATIQIEKDKIMVAPDAYQQDWTIIKINPIAYDNLKVVLNGTPHVDVTSVIWPNDLTNYNTNSNFFFLHADWKLTVINVSNNIAKLKIENLFNGDSFTTNVINVIGVQTFLVTINNIDLFEVKLTITKRLLVVDDYQIFNFGYDKQDFESGGFDNAEYEHYSHRGTSFDLNKPTPIKILPLGFTYDVDYNETLTFTFNEVGKYFSVQGTVSKNIPIVFLGQETEINGFRFRLVRSKEKFDIFEYEKFPRNYTNGYSQRAIDVEELKDGDQFIFQILKDKPNYLVHGSVTGYTKPALVGQYYWNGQIGFNLEKPYYRVSYGGEIKKEKCFKSDIVNIGNGGIIFTGNPKFDIEEELLELSFHSDWVYQRMIDGKRQFLVNSNKRGILPSIEINGRYDDIESGEYKVRDNNFFDFYIYDEGSYFDNKSISIEARSNNIKMKHSKDVIIFKEPLTSNLNVNTFKEDNLMLEVSGIHPELGTHTNLVPIYVVQNTNPNNYSLGYDGHLIKVGQTLYGNILKPSDYINPSALITSGITSIIEKQISINDSIDLYDGEFELEPFDTVQYDTEDNSTPNKPHENIPLVPDRGKTFDIFLSNVHYQTEEKHNKVGTISWQFDPDAKMMRQVIDFTELFVNKYLPLNSNINLKVEQADIYNDLVRVMIGESFQIGEVTIPIIGASVANIHISESINEVETDSVANNVAPKITEGLSIVCSNLFTGYDMYPYEYGQLTMYSDILYTDINVNMMGYDIDTGLEIIETIDINTLDNYIRYYTDYVLSIVYNLNTSLSSYILTGINGELVEGIDYIVVIKNGFTYCFILLSPQPISIEIYK